MKYEIRGNDEVARQPFNFYDNFFFPLSGELIACLNENWQGKTSSLSVNIEIPYFCEDDQSGTCDASRFGSTSEFTTTQIPLDHWHDILRAMEWDDIEVFEVSRRSLINHEILTRALDEIRKVGNLIRGSHWEEAISEMSKAFEGLADSLANGGGSKTGYNQLLKLVFPNDDRRQSSYNEVLRALRTMANSLARHGKKEPIFVTREEALFYYSTAVSIMSVFGKALSDTKRADVV